VRDIKFRLWSKTHKLFIPESSFTGSFSSKELGYSLNYFFAPYNFVIQQLVLTLDDKTELYEGDIVSWRDSAQYFDDGPDGDIMVVEWKGAKFVCRSLLGHGEWDADDCQIDKVEGNIFANPELLKNL
jgi:hypothetical protein